MDKIRVIGGKSLNGEVKIGGAKNAALPIMAACLLTEDEIVLSNLPHLADIATMINLLSQHGVRVSMVGNGVEIGSNLGKVFSFSAAEINNLVAPYDIVRKMRASVLVLGPLLARFGAAKVSLPGGCAIGTRPIDLHLKALQAMGASIELEEGYIHASVNGRLKGANIHFEKISVGATENILMAATLAEGTTILQNAAIEPEITDLAHCLNKMGARISNIGTSELVIEGVEKLHAAYHHVIADRIEAGTYMIAAAITKGNITISGISPQILGAVSDNLRKAGVEIEEGGDYLNVLAANCNINAVDIVTSPYPEFPTDMQAQFMALLTVAEGESSINETIFENRFMHVPELLRMGADISISGNKATIRGKKMLKAAPVMATDLRASVSLILAALAAQGETTINRVYHLDRGYERIEEKLCNLGAEIARVAN